MFAHDAVPEMLRSIWERNLPLIRERVDQLDHTARAALSNTLSSADIELAHANAHKLTGSLGTFGYPAGSDVARSIETLLETGTPIDGALLQQYATQLRTLLNLR